MYVVICYSACWYGLRLLENCKWQNIELNITSFWNIVISEQLLRAMTESNPIRSNRIESDWTLSSEKSLGPSRFLHVHLFGDVDRYVNFSFFRNEFCAMQRFNIGRQKERKILNARAHRIWCCSTCKVDHVHMWYVWYVCMALVWIAHIYWTRRPFRSGWTCFGFSFAFYLLIHSFILFSSPVFEPISSLLFAFSWHSNTIILGHRSILSAYYILNDIPQLKRI